MKSVSILLSSISVNGISTTTNVNPSSTSILEVSSSSSGARKKFSGTPVFLEININSSSDGATILIQQPFSIESNCFNDEFVSLMLLYI